MKVLILEDDLGRIKSFKKELIGHHVFFTDRADKAIEQLKKSKWDVLFLDHDLGGEVFVTKVENTGYEVAIWLKKHPKKKPATIFIHSLNPNGRKRMKDEIPEAIEAMFAWTIASNLVDAGKFGLTKPFKGSLPLIG